MTKSELYVNGIDVKYKKINKDDYISLTDLARYEAEKNDGVKTQKVKIVYNCVGTVSVPNTDNEPVKTDKTKIIEVA